MDLSHDDLRRDARVDDGTPRDASPGWRAALHRLFSRHATAATGTAKRADGAGRRQFLRASGLTVAGSVLVAGCGQSGETKAGESGTTIPPGTGSTTASTPTTSADEGQRTDVQLVKTATSVELLAVQLYDIVLGRSDMTLPSSITFDRSVTQAAQLFRTYHQAHAQSLQRLTSSLGETPYDKANTYLLDNMVRMALPSLTTQDAVVRFAYDVENMAASTYGYAASVLSTAQLRQAVVSIGGAEARYAAALALVLDPSGTSAVPRSFIDTSGPQRIPDDALVKS